MPAFVVYALIRRERAAEFVDASFAVACGVGWLRVGERPRGRKQPNQRIIRVD
jgi:hypothetical protein